MAEEAGRVEEVGGAEEIEEAAVVTKNLSKFYRVPVRDPGFVGGIRALFAPRIREVEAVKGVSFAIPSGQFVGYIGPNGAGKSTTVKMLSGILHPTSGQARVCGLSPQTQRERLSRQIGVVFGQRTQLWWDLPTIDSFEILSAMYGVQASDYRNFLAQFDDLLGIGEFLSTPVRKLSLGQRMRADLAAALIHRPRVLFLDEPTIGLDVVAKGRIRDFLRKINSEDGVTVLLTTHDLRDIEELCKRIIMIDRGVAIYDGAIKTLSAKAQLPTLLSVTYARLPDRISAGQYVDPEGAVSNDSPGNGWRVSKLSAPSGTITVEFHHGKSSVPTVLSGMQALGEIKDVALNEPSIEEVVRRVLEAQEP